MKPTLLLIVALALAGCTSAPGASTEPALTPAPAVVIQTVLVTVIPTLESSQPAAQVAPGVPSQQVVVVTATQAEVPPAPAGSTSAILAEPTATLPADVGGGIFTNLTRSGDAFSLRCQPDVLQFGVSSSDPYVAGVDFWYRIQDRLSVSISNWEFGGSMESDKHGNFTMAFPASRVDEDLRSHRAWFDYQFVAVNKGGEALGRSARIARQVTYTIDCTD